MDNKNIEMAHGNMGRNPRRFWKKIAVATALYFGVACPNASSQTTAEPLLDTRPFVGNGRIGIVISQDYCYRDSALVFEMGNTATLSPPDSPTVYPFGRFVLRAKNKVVAGQATTLLRKKGYVEGSFKTEKGGIKWRLLAAQSPSVGVLCLKLSGEEPFPDWHFISYITPNNFAAIPAPRTTIIDGVSLVWQEFPKQGSYTCAWDSVKIDYASEWDYVILFSSECEVGEEKNEASNAKAHGRLSNAKHRISTNSELDEILTTHENYWQDVYQHSDLHIPDSLLMRTYDDAIYRFASSTISVGEIIAENGPFLANPHRNPHAQIAWGNNFQQTYGFCFRAGLASLFAPVPSTLLKHDLTLARNTGLPRNDVATLAAYSFSDLTALLPQTSPAAANKPKEPAHFLLWTLYYYYQYCLYANSEEELLYRFYPLLQKAVNYSITRLQKDANGVYHFPEIQLNAAVVTQDATVELSLLRWGLLLLNKIHQETKIECVNIEKYGEVSRNLAPFAFDGNGLLPGVMKNFNPAACLGWEQLICFYPLQLYTWDHAEHRPLIARSVENLWNMPARCPTEKGYLYNVSASIAAWMENGDKALAMMHAHLEDYAETGFPLDRNAHQLSRPMGIANTIQDLLLQCNNNMVKIFPAVPSAWKNVSFHRWKIHGNITVDATWEDGRFKNVSFASPLKYPFQFPLLLPITKDQLEVNENPNIRFVREENGKSLYQISLPARSAVSMERKGE